MASEQPTHDPTWAKLSGSLFSILSELAEKMASEQPTHDPTWAKDFPTVGQGVIIFNMERSTDFSVYIAPKVETGEAGSDEWISLVVTRNTATFNMKHKGTLTQLATISNSDLPTVTGYQQEVGYESDRKVAYWVSYNRDLMQIKYGKGYVMEEAMVLFYDFLSSDDDDEETRKEYKELFNPYTRRKIEFYDCMPKHELISEYTKKIIDANVCNDQSLSAQCIARFGADTPLNREQEAEDVSKTLIDMENKVRLRPYPFVTNWSPFVLDSNKISLQQLDSDEYTFSASLPSACLELYSNVINCTLNSPDDPYPLSDAIQHSIDTEGCALWTTLNSKDEFGEDMSLTYLRVTCGPHRGKSAGIPYVLEIWPQQHGSPIHNHGNCYAVISVLYGGLDISIYNKHTTTNDEVPAKEISVKAGDCTWISPNWFQTHKLWNNDESKFCATIQCYQYGKCDMNEYPYFDFVSDEEVIDEFLPDSDYTFNDMKERVMAEYIEYMKTVPLTKN